MTAPERMSFAAYADPERDPDPPPPATPPTLPLKASPPDSVPAGDVWNPCGGYYAKHRCSERGCDTSKCRKNGKQFLVRCPLRGQAPYKFKGHALYKYPQCSHCVDREKAEAQP